MSRFTRGPADVRDRLNEVHDALFHPESIFAPSKYFQFERQPNGQVIIKLDLRPRADAPTNPEAGWIEDDFSGEVDGITAGGVHDIVTDYAFPMHIRYLELNSPYGCTVSLLWGPQGGDATEISFGADGTVLTVPADDDAEAHFDCSQEVPVLGFLRLKCVTSPDVGDAQIIRFGVDFLRPDG